MEISKIKLVRMIEHEVNQSSQKLATNFFDNHSSYSKAFGAHQANLAIKRRIEELFKEQSKSEEDE